MAGIGGLKSTLGLDASQATASVRNFTGELQKPAGIITQLEAKLADLQVQKRAAMNPSDVQALNLQIKSLTLQLNALNGNNLRSMRMESRALRFELHEVGYAVGAVMMLTSALGGDESSKGMKKLSEGMQKATMTAMGTAMAMMSMGESAAAIAGPAGLAVGVLTFLATFFTKTGDAAKEAAEKEKQAAEELDNFVRSYESWMSRMKGAPEANKEATRAERDILEAKVDYYNQIVDLDKKTLKSNQIVVDDTKWTTEQRAAYAQLSSEIAGKTTAQIIAIYEDHVKRLKVLQSAAANVTIEAKAPDVTIQDRIKSERDIYAAGRESLGVYYQHLVAMRNLARTAEDRLQLEIAIYELQKKTKEELPSGPDRSKIIKDRQDLSELERKMAEKDSIDKYEIERRRIENEYDSNVEHINKLSKDDDEKSDALAQAKKTRESELAKLKMTQTDDLHKKQTEDLDSLITDVDRLGNALSHAFGDAGDNFVLKMVAALQMVLEIKRALDETNAPGKGGEFGSVIRIVTSVLGLGTLGFDKGGYTGSAPASKPVGLVHGGEFVFEAPITQKYRPQLEALHSSLKGYAEGGYVDTPILSPIGLGGGGSVFGNNDAIVRELRAVRKAVAALEMKPAISIGQVFNEQDFYYKNKKLAELKKL